MRSGQAWPPKCGGTAWAESLRYRCAGRQTATEGARPKAWRPDQNAACIGDGEVIGAKADGGLAWASRSHFAGCTKGRVGSCARGSGEACRPPAGWWRVQGAAVHPGIGPGLKHAPAGQGIMRVRAHHRRGWSRGISATTVSSSHPNPCQQQTPLSARHRCPGFHHQAAPLRVKRRKPA